MACDTHTHTHAQKDIRSAECVLGWKPVNSPYTAAVIFASQFCWLSELTSDLYFMALPSYATCSISEKLEVPNLEAQEVTEKGLWLGSRKNLQ